MTMQTGFLLCKTVNFAWKNKIYDIISNYIKKKTVFLYLNLHLFHKNVVNCSRFREKPLRRDARVAEEARLESV